MTILSRARRLTIFFLGGGVGGGTYKMFACISLPFHFQTIIIIKKSNLPSFSVFIVNLMLGWHLFRYEKNISAS